METEYRIHCKTFKGVYIMKPNWETKHTWEVAGPATMLYFASVFYIQLPMKGWLELLRSAELHLVMQSPRNSFLGTLVGICVCFSQP